MHALAPVILTIALSAASHSSGQTSTPPSTVPPADAAPAAAAPAGPAQAGPAQAGPAQASAVAQPTGTTVCGQPVPPPARLPPTGSPPVIYAIVPCFEQQGGASAIDPQTYLHYIELRPSRPSQDTWVPYDAAAQDTMRADFKRLWATNFLTDLSVHVEDYVFSNGVVGKLAIYRMEERPRVKIVSYVGSTEIESTKIDETLKEQQITIRLDSFVDDTLIQRVKRTVRGMLSEKGFLDSTVTHAITPAATGGSKAVDLTFTVDEGPKYQIANIDFIGNTAIGDGKLKGQMKGTKERWMFSFITGRGTYVREKFEEDAEALIGFYRDRGYLRARVESPEIRTLESSKDGKVRRVEVRVPVNEGSRYRVGTFTIADNKVVKSEPLQTIFKLKTGEHYEEKELRKGMERARELYGSIGYFEFTAYPDFKFRDVSEDGQGNGAQAPPAASSAVPADAAPSTSGSSDAAKAEAAAPAIVDVTMHMQEGDQYFVNRINFVGNTTTRDHVIRREMNLAEAGVFNTEALKYSVRRINQLGYFKPIEEGKDREAVQVEKTPNEKGKVDVTLRFQEQNRNEVSFGGGYSQLDGIFMNGSFATSNFLGQGESVQVAMQVGARTNNYQLSFTEPFLLNRPISAGVVLYSRKVDYLIAFDEVGYSEARAGMSLTAGRPWFRFSRVFVNYTYEVIDARVRDDLIGGGDDDDGDGGSPGDPVFNPFLDEGRHIESRVSPSFVYNTVDNPFTPRRGMRITASVDMAGGLLGGSTNYFRPETEMILYIPHTRRTAFGLRGQAGWILPYGVTDGLPYYRRFFLGGENQIRGVDIRTVGPLDSQNRARGGDKFVLFNAEYYFDIAGPVRALAFHDAGQAYAEGDPINLRELRTSTGAELRVLVPMLNVPFRLIYAWNFYRDHFQPERGFRFAVGTTF